MTTRLRNTTVTSRTSSARCASFVLCDDTPRSQLAPQYDLFSKVVLDKMWELSDKHADEKCVLLSSLRRWSALLTQIFACREISIGFKLHHKLCKENADKLAEFVKKYGEDDSEAKTDVEAVSKALFREHRGSKTCVVCHFLLTHVLTRLSPQLPTLDGVRLAFRIDYSVRETDASFFAAVSTASRCSCQRYSAGCPPSTPPRRRCTTPTSRAPYRK